MSILNVTPANHGAYLHGLTLPHAQHPHQTADCKFAKFNNLYSAEDIGTKCQQTWTPSPSSPTYPALPSSFSPTALPMLVLGMAVEDCKDYVI